MGKIKVNWKKFYEDVEKQKKLRLKFKAPKYDNDMQELVKFFEKAARQSKSKTYDNSSDKVDYSDFGVSFKKQNYGFNYDSPKQFCVAKVRYSVNKQVHQKFLEHYMIQEDKPEVKNKPELFGNLSKDEYKKKMSNQCFKWILSPEKNLDEDQLKLFAEYFIQRTEQYIGRKLDWQAAIHQDTPHNHVHVLINGIDQNGNRFKLPPGYIKKYAREYLQDYLTTVLGERTPEDIALSKENRFYAQRYTEYDKYIELAEQKTNNDEYPTSVFTTEPRLLKRLEFLENFGIAKYQEGKYFLEKDWADSMRNTGKYNTYYVCKHDYKFKDRELKLYTDDIGKIKGNVSRYYNMNDEDIWNNAIVVDDIDGKTSWYVPLYKESDNLYKKDIELSMSKNQKGYYVPDVKVLSTVPKKADAGKSIKQEVQDITDKNKSVENKNNDIER